MLGEVPERKRTRNSSAISRYSGAIVRNSGAIQKVCKAKAPARNLRICMCLILLFIAHLLATKARANICVSMGSAGTTSFHLRRLVRKWLKRKGTAQIEGGCSKEAKAWLSKRGACYRGLAQAWIPNTARLYQKRSLVLRLVSTWQIQSGCFADQGPLEISPKRKATGERFMGD